MKEQKKPYTLSFRPSFVKEVDKRADRLGISRSQMLENMGEMAMDDIDLLDKVGLIDLALAGKKIIRKFKEKIFKGEITVDNEGEEILSKL